MTPQDSLKYIEMMKVILSETIQMDKIDFKIPPVQLLQRDRKFQYTLTNLEDRIVVYKGILLLHLKTDGPEYMHPCLSCYYKQPSFPYNRCPKYMIGDLLARKNDCNKK